jgi:hypothetical protein
MENFHWKGDVTGLVSPVIPELNFLPFFRSGKKENFSPFLGIMVFVLNRRAGNRGIFLG